MYDSSALTKNCTREKVCQKQIRYGVTTTTGCLVRLESIKYKFDDCRS